MRINYKAYLIPSIEVAAKLFAFANSLIIIRLLNPYEFGIYNYVLSFGLLISVFMDGGMNYYAFNSSIKNENKNLSLILNTKLSLSVIVIIVSYLVLNLLNVKYAVFILIFSINLLFTSSIAFFKVVARGKGIVSVDIYSILGEPVFRSIFLLIIVLMFQHFLSLSSLLIGFSFLGLSVFLIILLSINKKIELENLLIINAAKSWQLLKNTKFYLLYYFCLVAIQRIDVFFIKDKLGTETLGFFSSSYNLYLILQMFIVTLIMTEVKKAIVDKGYFKKIIIELFILIIIIIILGNIISEPIFHIIYPENYHDGYIQFNYLLWGLPFYILSALSIHFNNFYNKSRTNSKILISIVLIKLIVLLFYNFTSLNEFVFLIISIEAISAALFIINSNVFYAQKLNENSSYK